MKHDYRKVIKSFDLRYRSCLLDRFKYNVAKSVLLLFPLFRIAMGFVESLRVGAESIVAGLGAEIDRPAAIIQAREIRRVCVMEDPPAESDKARGFLLFGRIR